MYIPSWTDTCPLRADTRPGRHPPGQTPLEQTPPRQTLHGQTPPLTNTPRQTQTPGTHRPQAHTDPRHTPPWAGPLPETATAAGSTHPIGIHSCLIIFFISLPLFPKINHCRGCCQTCNSCACTAQMSTRPRDEVFIFSEVLICINKKNIFGDFGIKRVRAVLHRLLSRKETLNLFR